MKGPNLVDYLLYEPEPSGVCWIKFNRPERMNALMGLAHENGTVAKVGEYMRAADDDPDVRVALEEEELADGQQHVADEGGRGQGRAEHRDAAHRDQAQERLDFDSHRITAIRAQTA